MIYYSIYDIYEIIIVNCVKIYQACTQRPNDPGLQQELKRAAENLRYSVNAASGNTLIRKRIFDLEVSTIAVNRI